MRKIEFRNIIRFLHNRQNLNRINWFRTLQINFILLPFHIAKKLPILIYGPCKLGVLRGEVIFATEPYRGMLKIGITDPFRSIDSVSYIEHTGTILLGDEVVLRRGLHLVVLGQLSLGNHVYIGDNNYIYVLKNITLGSGTRIGNNTTMMDTDFHYIVNTANNSIKDNNAPIEIGEQNWIGGYCTIKKGTKTPKGTIIAGPYSMVGKDYTSIIKEYSLIAGSPAKLLVENVRRVNNVQSEQQLLKYFKKNSQPYTIPSEEIDAFCLPSTI